MTRNPHILLVAGEASADSHAAALLSELKRLIPGVSVYGIGGAQLAREGMNLIADARSLNVVGFVDWLDKLREVLSTYRRVIRDIKNSPPDLAILLDLPDFNLRLAETLKSKGVPVVYYISPQVWAWRKYRIRKIQKNIDRMLVVFPFEKIFYEKHGVSVQFVGHPLLERIQEKSHYRPQDEVVAAPRVAILPGSRSSELRHHSPILRELIIRLRQSFPRIEIKLPIAPTMDKTFVQNLVGNDVECVSGDSHEILRWADIAAVASGTATLETALIGTPFLLFYRLNPSSMFLFRRVAKYRNFIGMPNLLLQREVVREFVQEKMTCENLFNECVQLIKDPSYRATLARALVECHGILGQSGASQNAARAVVDVLHKKAGADRYPKLNPSLA